MEPKGRGGWLGLYIFQLFASPLVLAGREAGDLQAVIRQGAQLADGFFVAYIASILLCGAPLYAAGHFLLTGAKRTDAVNALKCMWIGFAALLLGPAIVFSRYYAIGLITEGLVFQAFTMLFWGVVWTLYIFKSQRVKNTFMPDGGWRTVDIPVSQDTGLVVTSNNASSDSTISENYQRESIMFDTAAVQRNWDEVEKPSKPDPTLVPAVNRISKNSQVEMAFTESENALKFTVFRANADEKWYWVLADSKRGKVLARSSGYETRSACIEDVQLLRSSTGAAEVWDKTANELLLQS